MNESGVDIEPIGDGVAIHLPRRELGSLRKVGWIIVGFSLLGTLFLIGWMATPVWWGVDLIRQGKTFGWLLVAFGCLGLGGLYATVKYLTLGISILRDKTHCSITVFENRILGRERFGWFSMKHKMERSEFKQIFVLPIGSVNDSRGETSGNQLVLGLVESFFGGDSRNFYGIANQKRNGTMLAPGYPKEILDSVAAAMAAELNRNSTESVLIVRDPIVQSNDGSTNSDMVTVQNLTEEDVDEADFTQPADSQIEIIEESDSTVYRIPERSLRSGTNGLFFFSVLWNGFMILFTTLVIRDMGNGIEWPIIAFLSIFWLVGIGLLVGSIYMAWQSALVGVKDGLLFIERKTIFGTRWTELTAEEVESIELGHANMEVNGVPVMNLKIQPMNEKAVGMFSHLDNEEIVWLAQRLRKSLGVESERNRHSVRNFDSSEPIEQLAKTDIEVQQDGNRSTITVPPHHFKGSRSFGALGLGFMVVPVPAAITAMQFVGFEFMLFLFVIVFSCFGAAMFFIHRLATTRNYLIVATDQQLDIAVHGFMSGNGLSAARAEIISINVFDSGTKLNNETLLCLKVKVKDRKGLTMMTGRNQKELLYVARLLHQRLKLDADVPADSEPVGD